MKRLLILAALLGSATPAFTANNYGVIVAGGGTTTFCAKDTGGGILSTCHVLTDSTGLPFGTSTNPLYTGIIGSVPVTGTFWQATQPVSVASLPLPSGAATESTQLNVLAQLSAAPSAIVAGDNIIGRTKLTDGTNVATIKAGSTAAVSTDTAQVVVNRDPIALASLPNPADVVTTPTLNTGTVGTYIEVPVAGAGEVALINAALPVGAVVQFSKRVGSTLYNTNPSISLPAGAAPPSNYGNTFTGTGGDVAFHFTGGGAQYIRETVLTAATGTTNVTWDATAAAGEVVALVSARATGGATPFHLVSSATTNSTLIAAGNHTLYSLQLTGLNTTAAYVHFYDSATAPASCGATTTPVSTYLVIGSATAQGGSNVPLPISGLAFISGLSMCITGAAADADNSAAVAGVLVNLGYK